MDTREVYILKCQQATEIQAAWKPVEGDYFYRPTSRPFLEEQVCVYDVHLLIRGPESGRLCFPEIVHGGPWGEHNQDGLEYIDDTGRLIWLPRQDQLQAMVKDIIDCPSHAASAILINFGYRLRQLVDGQDFHYWMQFTSMEQLWLAFVMNVKYQKRWTGEEWVKA